MDVERHLTSVGYWFSLVGYKWLCCSILATLGIWEMRMKGNLALCLEWQLGVCENSLLTFLYHDCFASSMRGGCLTVVPPSVKFKKTKKQKKTKCLVPQGYTVHFSHFPLSFVFKHFVWRKIFFFLMAYLDNVSSVQSNVVFFSLILKLKKKKGMLWN